MGDGSPQSRGHLPRPTRMEAGNGPPDEEASQPCSTGRDCSDFADRGSVWWQRRAAVGTALPAGDRRWTARPTSSSATSRARRSPSTPSIVAPEDEPHKNSYKPFEECTGVDDQVRGLARSSRRSCRCASSGGNAPDIAYVPQPGLLKTTGRDRQGQGGAAPRSSPTSTSTSARTGRPTAPSTASSTPPRSAPTSSRSSGTRPAAFKDDGYDGPARRGTSCMALSRQDRRGQPRPSRGARASSSGDATGWPATDWIEDVHAAHGRARGLRQVGQPRDPVQRPRRSPTALAEVGKILKNPKYVNGGLGDVKTIASTPFQDARPADPRRHLLHAPPGVASTRPTGRRAPRSPRTATSWPSTCRRSTPARQAGPRRWRVHRGLRRPSRGQGVPDLPVLARVGQRARQDLWLRRLRDGEQGRSTPTC